VHDKQHSTELRICISILRFLADSVAILRSTMTTTHNSTSWL